MCRGKEGGQEGTGHRRPESTLGLCLFLTCAREEFRTHFQFLSTFIVFLKGKKACFCMFLHMFVPNSAGPVKSSLSLLVWDHS